MPQFTYFIETPKQAVSPQDIIDAGLGYAMGDGDVPNGVPTVSGPEGKGGLIIQIIPKGSQPTMPRYDASKQTWRRGPGGKYFVGFDNDARPGPDDLRRSKLYDGQAVKLHDGNLWTVPRCFGMLDGRGPTLPQLMDLGEDGETLLLRVDPAYEKLCADAFEWWLQFTGRATDAQKLTMPQLVQLAVDALAVNYRIGKIETIGLLKLWNTDEFGLVLRAMIDADEIEAYARAAESEDESKKTEGGGVSAPPG